MISDTLHKRYLQQTLPIRLGGLAADLARIASTAPIPVVPAVTSLLEASRAFIEWATPDLVSERVNDAARLVEIQRELTRWQVSWHTAQHDPTARAQLAAQAQIWSDEILKMSGLLTP